MRGDGLSPLHRVSSFNLTHLLWVLFPTDAAPIVLVAFNSCLPMLALSAQNRTDWGRDLRRYKCPSMFCSGAPDTFITRRVLSPVR